MGRPAGYQWRPLGLDSDPVPGDPAQISQEAQHLASVAVEIANQVAALRKISSDGTEVGQHAEKIRSSASDTADQLDKLVGRYTKVSATLNSWIPDLEQAQAMSIQALDQAEGPYQKLNQAVILPSGPNLTAQQKQDVQNYHNAMQQAQNDLAAAQALLTRATTLRDNSGSHHADLINKACDDGMRDHHSFWGSITGFFSHVFSWVAGHWSQIVADVCTVLEVVATILAIAAFIIAQFVPGLNVLVDGVLLVNLLVAGGVILTGVALAGRIALAATGHGGWADVAVDGFALLTFGMGRLAGVAAKALLPGVEAASKTALTSELITAVATDGPRAAGLARFAAQQGTDSVTMAQKLGQLAPDLANNAKLGGFAKVMMNIGGFGKEEETYAKLIKLGARFTTPITDLSQVTTAAKVLTRVTGISTATSGVTGIAATVANGLELDWGGWKGVLDISSAHDWYYKTFEIPTGAPSG
jgi:hypothetical protein